MPIRKHRLLGCGLIDGCFEYLGLIKTERTLERRRNLTKTCNMYDKSDEIRVRHVISNQTYFFLLAKDIWNPRSGGRELHG